MQNLSKIVLPFVLAGAAALVGCGDKNDSALSKEQLEYLQKKVEEQKERAKQAEAEHQEFLRKQEKMIALYRDKAQGYWVSDREGMISFFYIKHMGGDQFDGFFAEKAKNGQYKSFEKLGGVLGAEGLYANAVLAHLVYDEATNELRLGNKLSFKKISKEEFERLKEQYQVEISAWTE